MRLNASTRAIGIKVGLIAFLALMSWGWSHTPSLLAQDAAAPAAADPAPPPPPPDPEGAAGAGHRQSYLGWIIESSGWIGAVILILSIYFVATVFRQMLELRVQNIAPPKLIEECEELLKARDYAGIYRLVKADSTMLGTLLTAGLTELQFGLPEAREAMDRAGEVSVVNMEKNISMLAVLGTLGPMIGLLGTLKGMIAAFSVIALSDTQLKASEVAGAISEALVLTFEGVALSVPSIFFYSLLKNRINVFSAEAMLMGDLFIRRLNTMYRGKGGEETQASS
ncbi:MotA/TolQ/ExbB proton channel family protein [Planctomicrobium piriforme]|uniref:Biopolymer transport protein ExbB n=1 Tax=Planctomicrobium piriforme TaxID=1576369 RepID=A0A1I3HFW3_9PLAN|nr:MotA/TolQ/ExbB proton channel family protein [Planctomicrobium piriforme]SFI34668.1 biopolymer transport protein ExbB [Planctomicrobium piriforme]